MSSLNLLFGWMPGALGLLFKGAVAIFVLVGLFKLVSAIIKVVTDLIPGW